MERQTYGEGVGDGVNVRMLSKNDNFIFWVRGIWSQTPTCV